MVRDDAYFKSITEQIIGSAYIVAKQLGYGFLEKVYENALAHELKKSGLKVEGQVPIKVYYDEIVVGDYIADLLIEEEIIVELKSAKNLENIHLAQCLNYLKATGKKLGLLINYGADKVHVKRVVNGL